MAFPVCADGHLGGRRLDPALRAGVGAYSLAAVFGSRLARRANGRAVCALEAAEGSPRHAGTVGGDPSTKAGRKNELHRAEHCILDRPLRFNLGCHCQLPKMKEMIIYI